MRQGEILVKKSLFLIATLLALPLALLAADRVVVLEIGTATWCPPCAAAAKGAEDLAEEHPGKVLIVEYHNNDNFSNNYANARNSFYGVTGIPTAVFDGVEKVVGSTGSNNFFVYNAKYNARAAIEPPLTISLKDITGSLQSTSGTLQATITNISGSTVEGKVHFTVTESHIPYVWQVMDSLHWVERTMLPDANGEAISLAPGGNTVITRDYTIDDSWYGFTEDDNIEFGCFVQGSDKEIYQGAVLKFGETTDFEEEADFVFSMNAPAIVSKQGFVKLALDAGASVDIALYDSIGQKVRTLHSGTLDAGNHSIAISTGDLPAGAYFIKATVGVGNQINKIVILD
jgi:thiol-disulfide isomerase/thioredoxin